MIRQTNTSRKKFLGLAMLALSLMVVGCQKDAKKTEDEKPLQLVQQEDKVFALDSLTNYARIFGTLIELDGKTNFVFDNEFQTRIYFYDYETGNLDDIVELYNEGPNGVPSRPIARLVHTKDSIFIHSIFKPDELYIVNRKGEVIYKNPTYDKKTEESSSLSASRDFYFDEASYINGKEIHVGISNYKREKTKTNPLRVSFNLTTNESHTPFLEKSKLIPDYEAFEALSLSKRGKQIGTNVVRKGDYFYASSSISDSIYEYKNGQYTTAYYAGNPNITLGDYKSYYESTSYEPFLVDGGGGVNVVENPDRPASFGRLIIDFEKEWIYRFLIENSEVKKVDGADQPRVVITESSIVAFNTNTKKSYTLKFPEEVDLNVNLHQIFANNNGIHFPSSDQETESEKRYNVYKLQ